MSRTSDNLIPVIIDRLLEQTDPHKTSSERIALQLRQLCGEWLMLTRLSNGTSISDVAEHAGISHQFVSHIELGTVDDDQVSDQVLGDLLEIYTREGSDENFCVTVLLGTLGLLDDTDEPFRMELDQSLSLLRFHVWSDVFSLEEQEQDTVRLTEHPFTLDDVNDLAFAASDPHFHAEYISQWTGFLKKSGLFVYDLRNIDLLHIEHPSFIYQTPEPLGGLCVMGAGGIGKTFIRGDIESQSDVTSSMASTKDVYIEQLISGSPKIVRSGSLRDELPICDSQFALMRYPYASEYVSNNARCVVLGEAGSGKTSLLFNIASQLVKDNIGGFMQSAIPVYCSFPEILRKSGKETSKLNMMSFWDAVADNLPGSEPVDLRQDRIYQLRGLANDGRVVLLLDGLDQTISNGHLHDLVAFWIENINSTLPLSTRVVITCRVGEFEGLDVASRRLLSRNAGWDIQTLLPFTQEQVREFVTRRCGLTSSQGSSLQTEYLLEWIKQDTRLGDLASSPRELTLITTLHLAARACAEPVKSTLLSWLVLGENNGNVSTTAHRKLACTTRFKYDLYETILDFLKTNVSAVDNTKFIRDVSDRFKEIVNHDWFNDFLKAREIALTHSFDEFGDYLWDIQREDNDDRKGSRDTYLFLFVALSVRGRYKELKHAWQLLLSHTTASGQPKTTYRIKQDTLIVAEAWQCLQLDQLVNLVLQQQFEQLRITLINQLMEILEAPYLDVAMYETRKKIGRYLSHLGDPRPGVNTLMPLWRQIPPDSQIYISYFPITNAQYRMFIYEGGYNDIRWWDEFPQVLNDYELGKSIASQDRYYNLSNQPVTGISWYEAIAFCRWLSYKIGYTVRLPLLNEWQEVVKQTPCDPAMSESFEPLDELVSVGCIPTVGDVVDVSGNLWEWTQDDVPTQEDGTITFAGKSQFVPYGYKMGDYQVVPRTTRGNRLGFRIVTSDE